MKKWIAFLALLLPVIAYGHSYYIDWFKVAGGGGFSASTDGLYSATVTIGQQDAGGPMQGAGYSFEGGFWSLYAEQQAPSMTGSAPQIMTQPQSQFVYSGTPTAFNVSVTGTPPFIFQWQKNGINLTDGGDVIGSTTSNLLFNAASPSDGGDYTLVVENAYGSVTSSVAILTAVFSNPDGKVAYLRSAQGEPWGLDCNDVILNEVFPSWQDLRYETVDLPELFSSSCKFIFMEGSDIDATALSTFLTNNLPAISNWVASGGSLFINAAPNVGNSFYLGFGATLNYPLYSPNVSAANSSHPIFNGPYIPVGTSFSGDWFAHATLSGAGLSPLLTNSSGEVVLAEASGGVGLGHVIFGGMTLPFFHSPQPEGSNLLANVLVYGAGLGSSSRNLIDAAYGPGSGSFELGDYNTNAATATGPQNNYGLAGGWVWSPSGNTITGWTCSSNVDWDWNRWQDTDGSKDVELGGDAYAASIYTTLHLDAGITYTLNFALSSTPTYNPGIVQVTFGTATQMFTNSAATIFTNMQWQTNTMTFTPTTSGSYQLQFYHPLFGSIPVIDAVSVVASVEVTNQPLPIDQYIQPAIQESSATRGEFTFSWNNLQAYPPVDYQVQYTTNLASGDWVNVGPLITDSITSFATPVGTNSQGFYRVELVQGVSANLLVDPGFETQSGWILFSGAQYSQNYRYSGSWSMLDAASDGVPGCYQQFPASSGMKFEMTGYGFTPNPLTGGTAYGILQITYFDSNNNNLGTVETSPGNALTSQEINSNTPAGAWTFLDTGVATAPPNTAYIQAFTLYVGFTGTNEGVYFDDLSLVQLN